MASKIRDRIVSNAVRCFARDGYSGCSTKEIALCANVTEGSLFRLCVSKEKLFEEALQLSLSTKKTKRANLRIASFALLENKGWTDVNRKLMNRLASVSPLIKELRCISH